MRAWTVAAVLAVSGAVLASPAGATAFDPSDFDGDGIPNDEDNCLVVPNPGQEPGDGVPDGAACSGEETGSTIEALRYGFNAGQLDAIYEFLPAGRMPGWGVHSEGRVRCQFSVECAGFDQSREGNEAVNDPLVPLLWKGQVWYTTDEGGYLHNRTLNDYVRSLPAYVSYGDSLLDGEPAIIADYPAEIGNPPPVNNIVLECRGIQTDVYFCFAWWFPIAPYVGPKTLLFHVFQDFADGRPPKPDPGEDPDPPYGGG